MTSPTVELASLLEVTPGYRGGRPCLRGTGLTVHNVAAAYRAGNSVEAIAASNSDLDPSLFHAAVAFYLANRERLDAEIDADLRAESATALRSPHRSER